MANIEGFFKLVFFNRKIALNGNSLQILKNIYFLYLNFVVGGGNCTELPLYLFESVIDIVEGQARILFVKLPYTLSTEEAERIGKSSFFSIHKKT